MKREAQLIAVTTPTLPVRLFQALLLTAIGFMVAQLLSYDYRKSLPESRIDVNKVYFNRGDVAVPPEEHDEYGDLLELPYNWRESGHITDKDEGTGWYLSLIHI